MGCVSCEKPILASESTDLPAAGHQLGTGPSFYAFEQNLQDIPQRAPLGQEVASQIPHPSEGTLELAKEGVFCSCHNLLLSCSLSLNLLASQGPG